LTSLAMQENLSVTETYLYLSWFRETQISQCWNRKVSWRE